MSLLLSQNTTGLPLPGWDLPSDLERMQELSGLTLNLMFNSREKKRLSAGVYLCWNRKVNYRGPGFIYICSITLN